MVEQTKRLDSVFGALADPTRRDILRRVEKKVLTIGEIAAPYDLSFAAVSKHLQVLDKARLIRKRRLGNRQFVQISPTAFKDVATYLRQYETMWNKRLDALERYLKGKKSV